MQHQGKRMTRNRRLGQQRGGTFLGLVLGLIVGLAIAVVVALYITKSPAPFQQKNAPRPAEQGNVASVLPTPGSQQQEPQDPNKPLWSKTPARPVGQPERPVDTVPEPGQSTPSQPPVARTPPERPARPVPPPRETPSTQPQPGDRMGERGATASNVPDRPEKADKPEKAAPREKPVADPIAEIAAADAARTSYLLQVGAFRSSEDADRQKANLAMQGFEAKITDRDVNGVKMYRVRLGPFAKVDDMNRARDRLQTAGFESSVIRFTRQ